MLTCVRFIKMVLKKTCFFCQFHFRNRFHPIDIIWTPIAALFDHLAFVIRLFDNVPFDE